MDKIIQNLQGGFYIISLLCIAYTIFDLRRRHKEKKKKAEKDKETWAELKAWGNEKGIPGSYYYRTHR